MKQNLGECVQQNCKAVNDATKAQVLESQARSKKAIDDLTNKRITLKQFRADLKDMQRGLQKTKATLDLNKCQIDKCNASLVDILNTSVDLLEYRCKTMKSQKGCDLVKKAGHIVRGKKGLTLSELQTVQTYIIDGAS